MDSESADSFQPAAKASDFQTPAEATSNVKQPTNTNDIKSHDKANDVEPPMKAHDIEPPKCGDNAPTVSVLTISSHDSLLPVISNGKSSWARNLRFPQPIAPSQDTQAGTAGTSAFARFTSGLGLRLQSMTLPPDLDSSRSAVKAVQVKARHIVSENKRRYQEGEFDLDMTYITENIIAMGFRAGDLSSGLLGFFEGFYRNHMEEVIKFFETHHKGRYKVYNLCSERLYDASLFQGKAASFPFNDHNCPPLQLIKSFCQSAYSWLKEDIENVVVVHCKSGMGRTGLMICSLLLFLKFLPTAEEAIDYFNQKRCIDGKALVLPSQIRYVKYFEHILTYFNGENQPGHRCMLRGSCFTGVLTGLGPPLPSLITVPEDFWIKVPKKGIVVFALPREPGLAELAGDFKIYFHDSQGDFYCWLNTTMVENRTILEATILEASDLDGFDKRNVPYPGFKIELVIVDYDGTLKTNSKASSANKGAEAIANSKQSKASGSKDNDDVFSDSDGEESGSSRSRQTQAGAEVTPAISSYLTNPAAEQMGTSKLATDHMDSMGASDIKAIAADASVFSFGDEEDYESQ
ncbi:hypothetical protein DITRI_Ditri16bG0038000 [Diplodiscus trichospermus]